MRTETDCPAEYSGGGVRQVDASGAVHAQPRALPAQALDHGEPVATRYLAAGVDVERAHPDDRVGQLSLRQLRLLDAVAVQGLPDDGGEPLPGERHPGQARHRLTVA